jgi:putative transposase
MRRPTARSHLVWCPKRRRALAGELGLWIDELAVEGDHVQVFLEFPPKYSIVRAVGIPKSLSASRTFARSGSLRRKVWSEEWWEDGCSAHTVGVEVTSDLLRRYIKRRAIRQATNQPELF